jgi:hypothetical protein
MEMKALSSIIGIEMNFKWLETENELNQRVSKKFNLRFKKKCVFLGFACN